MRSVILIIFILLILVSVFWSEYVMVTNFFDGLSFRVQKMLQETANGLNLRKNAEEIRDYWESHKEMMYVFENHGYFRNLEEIVHRLVYYADCGDTDHINFYLYSLISVADESKYDFSLTIGNVF